MHRPHISRDQDQTNFATYRQHYSYFSPNAAEYTIRVSQNAGNSGWKKPTDKMTQASLLQLGLGKKKSNSSLPKHENFGKISQSSTYRPPPETPTMNSNPKSQKTFPPPQIIPKPRAQMRAPSPIGHFQSPKAKQNKGLNSQYYQSLKMNTRTQQSKDLPKRKTKQQELQATGLKKIEEVTFSMDSTQPETDQKQHKNEYELPERRETVRLKQNLTSMSGGQFLTAFRKKIIQKQIVEKEKIYRSYIRSSSRETDQHQKTRLKSKMKEVLDDLYQLKKLIRN